MDDKLTEPLVVNEEGKDQEILNKFPVKPPEIHPDLHMGESTFGPAGVGSGPYAVPASDGNHFAFRSLDVMNTQQMNIFVSGLYVVVAVLMVIQGFGILVGGGLTSCKWLLTLFGTVC